MIPATLFGFGLMLPSQAEDLTLRLEGARSLIDFANTGFFLLEDNAPATETTTYEPRSGMRRGPTSDSYRAELDWDIALPSGQTLRLGGILARTSGSHHEDTPLYHYVATDMKYTPSGDHVVMHGIVIRCPFVDGQAEPCATFHGDLARSYREFAPQILWSNSAGSERTNWFGLQAFSGHLAETTSGTVINPNYAWKTLHADINADSTGFLFAFQHERRLTSGASLTASFGLGGYRTTASGITYMEGERNENAYRHEDFTGTRAQLALGIEYPLSDRVSLGGTVRADYWSDQPRVNSDLVETAPCSVTVPCHVKLPGPDPVGLTTDPLQSLSFGLSLTFRM